MPTNYPLTERQRKLVRKLFDDGGSAYLYGADVAVARKLEKAGLVTIEDYGAMRPHGRDDGERWDVTLTAAGCGVAGNLDAGGNIIPETT